MSNSFFQFKQFIIHQDKCAMKVTTDSCLFGAWIANDLQSDNKSKSLLDIGAGTGLLSLMVAQKIPQLYMDAIEIDADATAQGLENVNQSPWEERIRITTADAKHFNPEHKYDLIISNPPFYENELQSGSKQRDTAHHSKDLSLDDLLKTIKQVLHSEGSCYLLLPYKRKNDAEALLSKHGFTASHRVSVRQTIHHSYFRMMIKAGLQSSSTVEEEISIKDNNQQYTQQFTDLLKEYYLYL